MDSTRSQRKSPLIVGEKIDDLPELECDLGQPCQPNLDDLFGPWDQSQWSFPPYQPASSIGSSNDMLVALLYQRIVHLEQALFNQFRGDSITSRLSALEVDSTHSMVRISSVEERQDRHAERVGDLAKWQHQVAAMNGIQIADRTDKK